MSSLHLTLLGRPEVRLDSAVITGFESDKVRALLYFLASQAGQIFRREHLAHLLWSEFPQRRARQNLSQALLNLRKSVCDYDADPPFLHISRDALQFNCASDVQCDVDKFVRRLRQTENNDDIEELEETVALYRGPFLAGFSLADADPYEEWMRMQRERLHRMAFEAIDRVLTRYEGHHAWAPALFYARSLVELDPWREEVHRRLIHLLALNGHRSEALVQYQTCCRLLEEEFDAQPSAATVALYTRLREDLSIDDAHASYCADSMDVFTESITVRKEEIEAVCVGREAQLSMLDAFLESTVQDGTACVAFVTGPAGQGKTTLLREFARRGLRACPSLIVVGGGGAAYTGSGDVYAPFRSILGQLTGISTAGGPFDGLSVDHVRRLWSFAPLAISLLAQLGPDLIGTMVAASGLLQRVRSFWPVDDPVARPWLDVLQRHVEADQMVSIQARIEQRDLFAQATRLIDSLSKRHPLLIMLDDLQWADPGSLGLLFHLARQLIDSPVFFLCAYRDDEIVMTQTGQRHPLAGVVHELQQVSDTALIALGEQPDRLFLDKLIDLEPNSLDSGFRNHLFCQTGGHALFTVELLSAMRARGELYCDRKGFWIARTDLDWQALPPKVEAVIAERLEHLPGEWRRLLQVAAVQGDSFVAEIVATVEENCPSMVIQLLSERLGRQQGLVSPQVRTVVATGETRHSVYRFRHHLFQQYLYEELDPIERSLLHERIGNALAAHLGDRVNESAAEFTDAKIIDTAVSPML